ncbi:ExbD/TolR family protein [Botrimarina mediterranea]|uniref:Biopolymer transport protein ExbD/TolR n=1 Tax=Botrimarina mediterranea TaxID=2528022 RepID=A0A518K9U3_9BACT|nr:biopolymer transporter ExbD [Botrimarina mediterranea]QDV74567.1 Biopolymer transport protein ExbD/TolR [Botrimarina mediterranea]QDV79207.1 Biopolymer transport protein ExbD/TolR [Planctomycetes bacterium K2D]
MPFNPDAATLSPSLRRAKPGAGEDEVDITPMIDITFLLLIFFLVTSTPDQESSVRLPEALHGEAVSQLESTVFTIGEASGPLAPIYAADGKIDEFLLPEDAASRDAAIQKAVEAGLVDNKPNVIVKADKSVAYRHVAAVVTSISRVEGVNLHLAVLDTD